MRELRPTARPRPAGRLPRRCGPRPRPTRVGVTVCGALLLATLPGGCSQDDDERGKGDAPVRGRAGEDSAAEVYNFPDGFGNVATKCVGDGRRGYVTTRFQRADSQNDVEILPANAVVVDDPGCSTR
jgi:hypothetical protein